MKCLLLCCLLLLLFVCVHVWRQSSSNHNYAQVQWSVCYCVACLFVCVPVWRQSSSKLLPFGTCCFFSVKHQKPLKYCFSPRLLVPLSYCAYTAYLNVVREKEEGEEEDDESACWLVLRKITPLRATTVLVKLTQHPWANRHKSTCHCWQQSLYRCLLD